MGIGFCLGCGHKSHTVDLHYFFKNLLLYSGAEISLTECIVMMTKEEFTKIVNLITRGAGVLVLGSGHLVNMQYFSFLLFLSTLGHGLDKESKKQ